MSFLTTIESVLSVRESIGTKRVSPVVSTAERDCSGIFLPGTVAFCAIARPKQVNAMIYRKIRLKEDKLLSLRVQS